MKDVNDLLRKEISNTQVVILAGGKGKRMGTIDVPKPLIKIAGETLIERCIRFYKLNGFTEFVVLVGHKHNAIRSYLGNGSKFGVRIRYSVDPKDLKYVGKGKALKYAILSGAIDVTRRSLIGYPDDIFLDVSLPTRLLLQHLEAVKSKGVEATAVFTTATEYPFGVGEVDENGLVKSFKEKPVIKLLTSCGMYLIEPPVYKLIDERIDMEAQRVVEFEEVILPVLASRRKLYAMLIPMGVWMPINTQKEWEAAEKVLSSKKLPF